MGAWNKALVFNWLVDLSTSETAYAWQHWVSLYRLKNHDFWHVKIRGVDSVWQECLLKVMNEVCEAVPTGELMQLVPLPRRDRTFFVYEKLHPLAPLTASVKQFPCSKDFFHCVEDMSSYGLNKGRGV